MRARVAGLLCASLAGCTSTVTPPTLVTDPVPVFVLREAMHTGIVLPPLNDGGEFVEFGFGDWSWFALGNDEWYHVFATVLWPTQGALGRRTFGAHTPEQLVATVTWAELSRIEVDREKAAALHQRLQQQHDSRTAEAVRQARWVFVPADSDYWFVVTCADVAADWCRELGCTVGWTLIRGGLSVAEN